MIRARPGIESAVTTLGLATGWTLGEILGLSLSGMLGHLQRMKVES